MYVFKRDGQEVAAQEWPVWVQLQENGCYGLCNAADAQGVVLGGVVYSLSNRTPMEGTEEVVAEVVESVPYMREKMDTIENKLSLQTSATEVVFVTLAETGVIDAVTAGEHRTMFADWTAGVAYTVGQLRNYGEKLYRCVQAHTSQTGWEPDKAASLWAVAADPAEAWPVWSQPTGAHDAYSAGDRVSHNGKYWTSLVDNNVWEPGATGTESLWAEVTE